MTWPIKLAIALALLCGIVSGYFMWSNYEQGIGEARATATYNTAINKQKASAAELLATETAKAKAAMAALADLKTEREKQDVQNKIAIDSLATRLRTAAGAAGRLRDPNAAGCGGGGGGATGADSVIAGSSAGYDSKAAGLLSAGATELFQRLTREADEINTAYISCRADALNIRASNY